MGKRVRIRYTICSDRKFDIPWPGANGKILEFVLDKGDADPGLETAVHGMKVGGMRALLSREEVVPALARTLDGVQAGTQIAIRIELLDMW